MKAKTAFIEISYNRILQLWQCYISSSLLYFSELGRHLPGNLVYLDLDFKNIPVPFAQEMIPPYFHQGQPPYFLHL